MIPLESEDSESEVDSDTSPNDFQTEWFNAKEVEETKTSVSFKATKKNLKQDDSYSVKYKSKKISATKSEKVVAKKPPALPEDEQKKLTNELTLMGFPQDLAKKAIESGNTNVISDLVDLILKDLSSGNMESQIH